VGWVKIFDLAGYLLMISVDQAELVFEVTSDQSCEHLVVGLLLVA
jgi:hypothetical protein